MLAEKIFFPFSAIVKLLRLFVWLLYGLLSQLMMLRVIIALLGAEVACLSPLHVGESYKDRKQHLNEQV